MTEHTLLDHLFQLTKGEGLACCEAEILVGFGIVLGLIAISAICAPFLNPGPTGD